MLTSTQHRVLNDPKDRIQIQLNFNLMKSTDHIDQIRTVDVSLANKALLSSHIVADLSQNRASCHKGYTEI